MAKAFAGNHSTPPKQQDALRGLLTYLKTEQSAVDLHLSLERFAADLEKGLYFDSNIPVGYGLGSSGALTAAVFDRFYEGAEVVDLPLLKEKMAQIEAHFHGASSGIDPLICYLRTAIMMESTSQLRRVNIPDWTQEAGQLFLLNTQLPRQTGPLVNIFRERCQEEYYRLHCETELAPLTNDAIHAFLQKNWDLLFPCVHEISHFQFRYFDAMIPKAFRSIWLDGLGADLYKLKLCGAGGGGFILGFTNDWIETQRALKDYQLLKIR
ncbi:MAG: mevalonate kinase [Bacteroidota bacterium]